MTPADWSALVGAPANAIFGEPVTFYPAAGGSFVITGVYDEAYAEVDETSGVPISTTRPALGVQLADFAAAGQAEPLQGDQLVLDRTGERFVVTNVNPDGLGGAFLPLNYIGG